MHFHNLIRFSLFLLSSLPSSDPITSTTVVAREWEYRTGSMKRIWSCINKASWNISDWLKKKGKKRSLSHFSSSRVSLMVLKRMKGEEEKLNSNEEDRERVWMAFSDFFSSVFQQRRTSNWSLLLLVWFEHFFFHHLKGEYVDICQFSSNWCEITIKCKAKKNFSHLVLGDLYQRTRFQWKWSSIGLLSNT